MRSLPAAVVLLIVMESKMERVKDKLHKMHESYLSFRKHLVRRELNRLKKLSFCCTTYAIISPILISLFVDKGQNVYHQSEALGLVAITFLVLTTFLSHFKWINRPERERLLTNIVDMVVFISFLGYTSWGSFTLFVSYKAGRGIHIVPWIIMYLLLTAFYTMMPYMAVIANGLSFANIILVIRIACDGNAKNEDYYNIIMAIVFITFLMIDKYHYELGEFKQSVSLLNQRKDKEHFLVNMTHEMRTPLNAVLGKNRIIYNDTKEDSTKKLSQEINSSGKLLLSLINDILDFSKMEAGRMKINPVEYSSYGISYEIADIMKSEAQEKGIGFKIEVSENLPASLFGDDVRIRQVIMNLVSNAIKYTKEGSVTLRIWFSYLKPESKTGMLNVMVIDTGIGIKEEDLPTLTKAFSRLDEGKNRTVVGTGLGLAITSSLLNMMGSELKVSSKYEIGSTFSFSVEQKVTDETPLRKTDYMNREKKRMFKATELEVLVVDDNMVNFSVCNGLMKYYAIAPDHADSGEKCLEMLAVKDYDLIFLDHLMPGMDGVETLNRIKADYPSIYAKVPVVALTANEDSDAAEKYRSLGFTDYLGKPIDSDRLHDVLDQYIDERKKTYIN